MRVHIHGVDITYSDVIYNQALVQVIEFDGNDLTTYGLNAPMRNNENMLSRELMRQTNRDRGIVFLDAPGGTGNTFLINLILAKIRLLRHHMTLLRLWTIQHCNA